MRKRLPKLLLALLIVLAPVAAFSLVHHEVVAAPSNGLANATVMIVRHAEKPPSGPWLSNVGEVRAQAYVRYFSQLRLGGAPVHIDELVAAADRPQSYRSRLTLTPLSRALGLPIELAFDGADINGVADWLRQRANGKTVLVAWHHSDIPDLIAALGEAPSKLLASGKWPDGSFDDVIVLRYDEHGRVIPSQTTRLAENIAV